MPYRQTPRSDTERVTALDAAFTKWNNTNPADRLITDAQFAQLMATPPNPPAGFVPSLRARFETQFGEAGAALSEQPT